MSYSFIINRDGGIGQNICHFLEKYYPRNYAVLVLDTPKNNYAADVAKPHYFRRTDTGALVFCSLRDDADKAKADTEQHTKREIRNSKDFLANIKDRFLTLLSLDKPRPHIKSTLKSEKQEIAIDQEL